MQVISNYFTTKEWELLIGEQVRATRIVHNLDQVDLAENANVSVGTVVAVARALDRTDWLQALAPTVTISPIQMLRGKSKSAPKRVRSRRSDIEGIQAP
jgi:transcriptional regulator with XRE-family HTH domain